MIEQEREEEIKRLVRQSEADNSKLNSDLASDSESERNDKQKPKKGHLAQLIERNRLKKLQMAEEVNSQEAMVNQIDQKIKTLKNKIKKRKSVSYSANRENIDGD